MVILDLTDMPFPDIEIGEILFTGLQSRLEFFRGQREIRLRGHIQFRNGVLAQDAVHVIVPRLNDQTLVVTAGVQLEST